MSALEETFATQCMATGLPVPEREYRFHDVRRFRFDFAWPEKMVCAEIEGGVWVRGRHNRPKGFISDCEKYNLATKMGWKVFRFPEGMVTSGDAVAMIESVLGAIK